MTIITVEEALSGWFTFLRKARQPAKVAFAYAELADVARSLQEYAIVDFDLAAIARYESLKRMKLRVKGNDLRIAAIALELGATVVTHNLQDFTRVPGLAAADWAA